MVIYDKERRILEQMLSNAKNIYSVEDDRFLYYVKDGVLNIVKGDTLYSMKVEEWEDFAHKMISVSDEYFVTGPGVNLKKRGFLGGYLSRYNRRKEWASDLIYIIEDSREWTD